MSKNCSPPVPDAPSVVQRKKFPPEHTGWPWGSTVWLAAIGASVLGLVTMALLGPYVPVDGRIGFLAAFAYTAACVLGVALYAPMLSGPRWLTLLMPLGALLGVRMAELGGLPGAVAVMAALLWAGTALGASIGARVEHPGHVLVVAVVSSIADLWSVFHPAGATAALVERPQTLAVLALPGALLGTSAIEPLLGVGDVVFSALYLRAARVLALSERRMATALGVGYAVTLLLVVGLERPLPALPILGLCAVASDRRARRLPPSDRRKALWIMGILILLVGLAFALRR